MLVHEPSTHMKDGALSLLPVLIITLADSALFLLYVVPCCLQTCI